MKNVKNTFSKSGNVSFLIFFETPNFLAWTFSGNEVSEELRAENYVEFQYSSQCESPQERLLEKYSPGISNGKEIEQQTFNKSNFCKD